MQTTLVTDWTVGDICKGFVFDKNEGKGLFGLNGQLSSSMNISTIISTVTANVI